MKQRIALSPSELASLNSISRSSQMIEDLNYTDGVSTEKIAQLLSQPLAFLHRYTAWADVSKRWGDSISAHKSEGDDQRLNALIEEVSSVHDAPGLSQAVVGMIWSQYLQLPDRRDTCRQSLKGRIPYNKDEEGYALNFPRYRIVLVGSNDPSERVTTAERFAELFTGGCLDSLAEIFAGASPIFRDEATKMSNYISTWDRILSNKQSDLIRIFAGISNNGRYNSFLRKVAKVGVGKDDGTDPYTFIANIVDEKDDDSMDKYLKVDSRSTKPVIFAARLSADQRNKILGAYQVDWSWLRLGVLAGDEHTIYSHVAPFSEKTKEEFEGRINDIKIKIPKQSGFLARL
jgi:hypothetical protein